jgi:nicotinamidase-related amidase
LSNRTLLMIDVQRNMLLPPQPVRDAPAVGSKIARILEQARSSGAMVVHVRNNGGEDDPDAPGTMGWELVHDSAGSEAVIDKRTPNSFAGTKLGSLLADARDLVIVGMQSEYCVRETSLAALEQGFTVLVPRGADATYGNGQRSADSRSRRGRTRTGRSTNPRRRRRHLLNDQLAGQPRLPSGR